MAQRLLGTFGVIACLVFLSVSVTADPPNDDEDWLTWSPKNIEGGTINLSSYEDKTVFVLVFAPDCTDACDMTRAIAAHVRAHPSHAGKVLAMCTGSSGAKAIRRYLRQEEFARRVEHWNDEQDEAKAAAQLAHETYRRPAMPKFAKLIEAALDTQQGRNALMAHHLPFTTCARCEEMWSWLCKRMTKPTTVPRVLKFSSEGAKLNEWSCLPSPNPIS